MASIGEQLRQAREARGFSIQDVEQATHIRRVFILALEEDRLQDLPDPAYGRGFVAAFARYVGLDPEPLVQTYTRQVGARDLVVPTVLDEPLFDRASNGIKSALRFLLIALLIAAAGWVAYSYLYLNQTPWSFNRLQGAAAPTATVPTTARPAEPTAMPSPTATPAPNTASSSSPTPMPTTAPTQTPASAVALTPGATLTAMARTPSPAANLPATEGLPADEGLPVVEGFTARIVSTGYTWLNVFVDEQQELLGYLNAGDERSWTAVNSMELRIGNAAAVSVEINGQDVGPVGGAGEVITLRYTADNLP